MGKKAAASVAGRKFWRGLRTVKHTRGNIQHCYRKAEGKHRVYNWIDLTAAWKHVSCAQLEHA